MASLAAPVTGHLVGRYSDRAGNHLMAVLANFLLCALAVCAFPWSEKPLDLKGNMKRLFLTALAAASFATCVHAQSNASGPLVTPSGELQFERVDRGFVATVDNDIFDRFGANALTHFDDIGGANDTVARMLVQTDSGPVLYDFRHHPPTVERLTMRMMVKRVFWQGDEVVMQGPQGWFRFKQGVLTKLQSSTTTYH
jgi:hypothetical protein